MSLYRDQLEAWLKTIDVKADCVLDIGGGANHVEGRTKSWDVIHYDIWDNNAEGEFTKEPIDLNESWITEKEAKKIRVKSYCAVWYDLYGVIFCLEVFEYIWNPVVAMRNIYGRLVDMGIAYITFPSTYPIHNPKKIDYLRYTEQGIIKLLQEGGFKRWEILPRVASEKAQEAYANFVRVDGMRAVKNDPAIYDVGYMVKAIK